MKSILRGVFAFIFKLFESGTGDFEYKPSQRLILAIIGLLFLGMSTLVLLLIPDELSGYLFPAIIFGIVGCVCLLVAYAGSDRGVARIWSAGK